MCGFVGLFRHNKQINRVHDFVEMTDCIRHRGPDDNGIVLFSFHGGNWREIDPSRPPESEVPFEGAIGCNRLKIIDLSENGHQPMIDNKRKTILAFNGEIYNAFEYRDFLQDKGFQFRGRSDTEILLYLYEYYGFQGMLEKLNGMFAICIIDLKEQRIFLARDRMGIKPLYYYTKGDLVLFSSEVKSFLFNKEFEARLDSTHLDEHTKFGAIYGRETLLQDVYNVEPGEFIVIDGDNIRRQTYWSIYNEDQPEDLNLREACDRVEESVLRSLKLRMISDVKVGCQLSGGIDSSLITLFAGNHLKEYDLNAISIIFEDPLFSEEPWIDYVAGTANIHSHKYTLTREYFFQNLCSSVWHYDFPLLHPSSVAIKLLSEKARDYFTVFLSGEGSDELFAGYERFYGGHILDKRAYSFLIRNNPYLRHYIWDRYMTLSPNRFDHVDWYITRSSYLSLDTLKEIKDDFRIERFMTRRRELFNSGAGDFVRKAQRYELRTWLVDVLIRQDKMTMANSIENRVPFIDHHLVELARRIPTKHLAKTHLSVRKGTKVVLKEIASKHFNKRFAYRYKVGFATPLRHFFGFPAFQEWVLDSILPSIQRRGVYNGRRIPQYIKNLANLNEEQLQALWRLVNFEIWANLFLDRKQVAEM